MVIGGTLQTTDEATEGHRKRPQHYAFYHRPWCLHNSFIKKSFTVTWRMVGVMQPTLKERAIINSKLVTALFKKLRIIILASYVDHRR